MHRTYLKQIFRHSLAKISTPLPRKILKSKWRLAISYVCVSFTRFFFSIFRDGAPLGHGCCTIFDGNRCSHSSYSLHTESYFGTFPEIYEIPVWIVNRDLLECWKTISVREICQEIAWMSLIVLGTLFVICSILLVFSYRNKHYLRKYHRFHKECVYGTILSGIEFFFSFLWHTKYFLRK